MNPQIIPVTDDHSGIETHCFGDRHLANSTAPSGILPKHLEKRVSKIARLYNRHT